MELRGTSLLGTTFLCMIGYAQSYDLAQAQKRDDLSTALPTATAPVQNSTTPITTSRTSTPVPSPPHIPLFDCYMSSMDYNSEYISADHNRTPSIQPYTTSISSRISYPSDTEWYTLCDGFPRAKNPPVSTTYLYTTITDYNASYTYYMMPPMTLTDPQCSYCDRCPDCHALSSFIDYQSSKWSDQPEPRTPSSINWYLPCIDDTFSTTTSTSVVTYPTASDGPSCLLIAEDPATLYYWPVTTADGDFCKYNGTTVTPTPTAADGSPNTAVINGLTVTSPSAYLIVDRIEARVLSGRGRRTRWEEMGVFTSQTMTFAPDALSHHYPKGNRVRWGWELNTQSINWQDFNTPPYSVYSKAQCSRACCGCERQYHSYAPYIGVPKEIQTKSKDWEYCSAWGWLRPAAVPITAGVTTTMDVHPAIITDSPIETAV